MKLENILLPNRPPNEAFDIEYADGKIQALTPRSQDITSSTEKPPSLLLPALCHPHIHLDKAYLLTSNAPRSNDDDDDDKHPDYADLNLSSGTFAEALQNTSQAKTRYTPDDLLLRGAQLIEESILHGVSSMRAFVEVDHVTGTKTLDAAVTLKQRYAEHCTVQICAFAQDPIFSGDHGSTNRRLIEDALQRYKSWIDVLGTTPYVEDTYERGLENVSWAVDTAIRHDLHLDFHLDYNLDETQKPMVLDVGRILDEKEWVRHDNDNNTTGEPAQKTIVLGHCTRMTLLSKAELHSLAKMIKRAHLPVSFVGLPTSDLFMMGRPTDDQNDNDRQTQKPTGNRPRGTLQILDLISKYDVQACIGVNNVGNAFTPWGSADPLRLASLGVGVYQAGTVEDARMLYECVSTRARRAIGLDFDFDLDRGLDKSSRTDDDQDEEMDGFEVSRFVGGGMLVIENETSILDGGPRRGVPARQRVSVKDVVWDPPDSRLRRLIYKT